MTINDYYAEAIIFAVISVCCFLEKRALMPHKTTQNEVLEKSAIRATQDAQGILRDAMRRADVSPKELAERLGITVECVRQYLQASNNIKIKTLIKCLLACGFEPRFGFEPIEGFSFESAAEKQSSAGYQTEKLVARNAVLERFEKGGIAVFSHSQLNGGMERVGPGYYPYGMAISDMADVYYVSTPHRGYYRAKKPS